MPSYKLYYFNGRGRAEVSRFIFAQANVPYEDIRLTREEWVKFKPDTPNEQLPVLEIDGKRYGQSHAIADYLAETFGLFGETPLDRLMINGMVQTAVDRTKNWPFDEKDAEIKAKKEKEMLENDIGPFLKHVEDDVMNRNQFRSFFLDKVSVGDFYLVGLYEIMEAAGHANIFDKTPKLMQLINKIRDLPNIEKWIESRPKSLY